jgi:O-antigen ligase
MGLAIGLGLLVYRHFTPWLPARWALAGAALAVTLGAMMLILPSPFGFIFQHFTLDPETGWYRLVIWQVAGALVLANPLFGVGLDDWARESWMPSTVDSLWLRNAMTFGIVGSALIATVMIGACSRAMRPRGRAALPAADQALGLALGIILFLYVYLGFTVHFWGSPWILLGFFAGLRAHLGALAASQPATGGAG